MKSALERAMERFGGDQEQPRSLNQEQKEKLAEIDREYEAKIARARMTAEEKSRYLEDPSEIQQLRQDTGREVEVYEEKREQEKDALRRQFAEAANESVEDSGTGEQ